MQIGKNELKLCNALYAVAQQNQEMTWEFCEPRQNFHCLPDHLPFKFNFIFNSKLRVFTKLCFKCGPLLASFHEIVRVSSIFSDVMPQIV